MDPISSRPSKFKLPSLFSSFVLLAILAQVALLAGLGYVVAHFVVKFW